METDIYFSACADIARRAGVVGSRYRTKDYRFIITDKDLSAIRLVMTPEEYITGIDVVKITEAEAKRLISENDYQIGEEYENPQGSPTEGEYMETEQADSEGQESAEEQDTADEQTPDEDADLQEEEDNEQTQNEEE